MPPTDLGFDADRLARLDTVLHRYVDEGKLPGVHQSTATTTPTTVELKVSLLDESVIGAVVQSLVTSGGRILTMKKVEPTLEDVFIELVGHGLSDEEIPTPQAS